MQKKIAVFGSGIIKKGSRQFKIAYEIGFSLAKAGFVVANGGYGGSMLASAKGAKEAGGKTIGVTTDDFGSSRSNQESKICALRGYVRIPSFRRARRKNSSPL